VPRSTSRTHGSSSTPKVPAHGALLTTDLAEWAGKRIAAGGRRDALLGRVELLLVAPDGRSIDSRVRGNRPMPYRVKVWVIEQGLASRCTCAGTPVACKHAVAAVEVLRFPLPSVPGAAAPTGRRRTSAGRMSRGKGRIIHNAPAAPGFVVLGALQRTWTRDERLASAASDEIAARRQRARRDKARVRLLDTGDGPVRFAVADRVLQKDCVVTLRGPKSKLASCTCNDYAENELQSCRHVERVRTWYLRKKKRVPRDLISVWWCPRAWPEQVPNPLREIRLELPEGHPAPPVLKRYFNEEGWLRPVPPSVRRADWVAEAVERARGAASRRKWNLDLDERLQRLIDDALRDEHREAALEATGPRSRVWQRIKSNLGFRLHPYQERGSLFLAKCGRAFLADDMGLGKTVQAIAAALVLRSMVGAKKFLVICPASLKYQWRREIEKACGEQATVVDGQRARRLRDYSEWEDGFLILNYELVLRDLETIRDAGADIVLLDEAQRIKNWDTKTARAVKQLRTPYTFVLTGTPLENRLIELHSLVEFLHPRALGPRWRLLPYHAVTENEGQIIAYEGLDVLRNRLRGFFLRRERSQVLDQLPPRTDNTFWTGMTPAQRRPYRQHAARLAALISGPQPLRPLEVRLLLQSLTSMRILCNAYGQYAWSEYSERVLADVAPTEAERKAVHSPKLEEFARVLEDLLDDSPDKIVVFSQWERMLRLAHYMVFELLERRDVRAEVFHGGLSSRARGDVLEAFRADPEVRVLLSTDAGGLGLNLQESASVVVNLEVPWNPAVLEQRIGRVHRIGQRKSVQVLHFVTKGMLEERVRAVVESKRALFEGLLVDEVDQVVFDDARRDTFVQRVRTLIGDSD